MDAVVVVEAGLQSEVAGDLGAGGVSEVLEDMEEVPTVEALRLEDEEVFGLEDTVAEEVLDSHHTRRGDCFIFLVHNHS